MGVRWRHCRRKNNDQLELADGSDSCADAAQINGGEKSMPLLHWIRDDDDLTRFSPGALEDDYHCGWR
jgi:hypothetical protein